MLVAPPDNGGAVHRYIITIEGPSFEDVVEKGPGTFLGGFGLSSLSVILAAVGIAVAFRWYRRGIPSPTEDPLIERLGTAGQVFGHAYYFDETIASAFSERGIGRRLAEWLRTFDERVIDGAVNGTGVLVRQAALVLRRVQSGLVRNYAAYIAIGAAALLLFLLLYAGR